MLLVSSGPKGLFLPQFSFGGCHEDKQAARRRKVRSRKEGADQR